MTDVDSNDLTKNIKKEITYLERGNDEEETIGKAQQLKNLLLRKTIRPILSVAVNKIHSGFKGKYHDQIFKYDDPRLLFLDKLSKDFVKEHVERKNDADILNKLIDISLGMLKEDIYYRVRGFILLNRFMEENVRFVLTEEEKKMLE
jgi:hypothetical protein